MITLTKRGNEILELVYQGATGLATEAEIVVLQRAKRIATLTDLRMAARRHRIPSGWRYLTPEKALKVVLDLLDRGWIEEVDE